MTAEKPFNIRCLEQKIFMQILNCPHGGTVESICFITMKIRLPNFIISAVFRKLYNYVERPLVAKPKEGVINKKYTRT